MSHNFMTNVVGATNTYSVEGTIQEHDKHFAPNMDFISKLFLVVMVDKDNTRHRRTIGVWHKLHTGELIISWEVYISALDHCRKVNFRKFLHLTLISKIVYVVRVE